MTERIDHVAAAKQWIENSVKAQASTQPNNEQLAAAYAEIGQVHATLALVEQQRIANLIALDQHTEWTGSPEEWQQERTMRADVREALGL